MKEVKKKKATMDCGLCVDEGKSKAATFNGTRAQIKKHVEAAHKGKAIK